MSDKNNLISKGGGWQEKKEAKERMKCYLCERMLGTTVFVSVDSLLTRLGGQTSGFYEDRPITAADNFRYHGPSDSRVFQARNVL